MGRVRILPGVKATNLIHSGESEDTTRGEGHKSSTVVGRVRILPGVKTTKFNTVVGRVRILPGVKTTKAMQ